MTIEESVLAIVAIGLVWTVIGPAIFLPRGEGERDLFDYGPVGFAVSCFLCGPIFWFIGSMSGIQSLPRVIYKMMKRKKETHND